MRSILFAAQFLTIIPIKIKYIDEKIPPNSLVYFPVVGLFLGLILGGANLLLSILRFDEFAASVILIVSLIVLTGGIHLDGLSDTFDALLSGKEKDKMLDIMRDPHIGVMGVLSIVSIILLKISFLSSIDSTLKMISLLLSCVLSRWALVFLMFLFPYARREGKAKIFMQHINYRIFSLATMITLVLVIWVWQLKGLSIFLVVSVIAYIIGKFINNKIGGMTGDTLGAMNEIIEAIVLFSIFFLNRSGLWIISKSCL